MAQAVKITAWSVRAIAREVWGLNVKVFKPIGRRQCGSWATNPLHLPNKGAIQYAGHTWIVLQNPFAIALAVLSSPEKPEEPARRSE